MRHLVHRCITRSQWPSYFQNNIIFSGEVQSSVLYLCFIFIFQLNVVAKTLNSITSLSCVFSSQTCHEIVLEIRVLCSASISCFISWFRFSSFFLSVVDPGMGGIGLVSPAPSCASRKRRSLPGVPFSQALAAISRPYPRPGGHSSFWWNFLGSHKKFCKNDQWGVNYRRGFWKCYTVLLPRTERTSGSATVVASLPFLLFYFAYLASTCDVGL